MRRLYSKPNAFRRTVLLGPRLHVHKGTVEALAAGLSGPRRQGSVVAANEANVSHAKLVASEEARQSKKHLVSFVEAVNLVANSGDKRRRPRGVSKEDFKRMRKLKLTQTAKIKRKKTPTTAPT